MNPSFDTKVILVDSRDQFIGEAGKLEVHQLGLLHRAVSIFLFNEKGDTLVQRRALDKYHCPGLWSNSCCSHPIPGEATEDAALRRLQEELGVECKLIQLAQISYRSELPNGLIEHEIDHVFAGRWCGEVKINPEEVCEYRWLEPYLLMNHLLEKPELYTPWFPLLLPVVTSRYRNAEKYYH